MSLDCRESRDQRGFLREVLTASGLRSRMDPDPIGVRPSIGLRAKLLRELALMVGNYVATMYVYCAMFDECLIVRVAIAVERSHGALSTSLELIATLMKGFPSRVLKEERRRSLADPWLFHLGLLPFPSFPFLDELCLCCCCC